MPFWRSVRILALLLVLLFVAVNAYLSKVRTTDWDAPLWVVIYPINADGSEVSDQHISRLVESDFDDIEAFFEREAKRYRLRLERPVHVLLSDPLEALPPEPPENPSIVDNVLWSLQMRFWSWWEDNWDGAEPDVRIYMRFYEPEKDKMLKHSLGLQKGLIGLVNAFASEKQQGQNNLIAAHELLHTVGASDKYDPTSGWPIWPDGYAEPNQIPRFPQTHAEIMGGRVQVTPSVALIPPSLEDVVVGAATAIEINWMSPEAQRN
jgi:hypothetical protein